MGEHNMRYSKRLFFLTGMLLLFQGTLLADTISCTTTSISSGSLAQAAPIKDCLDNIKTWSTNIDDGNIQTGAAIDSAKISGTALTLSGAQTITGDKTITGAIQGGSPFVLEGATADAFELTVAIPDVTGNITY